MITNLPPQGYLSGGLNFTPEQWSAIHADRKLWLSVRQKYDETKALFPKDYMVKLRQWRQSFQDMEQQAEIRRRLVAVHNLSIHGP